MNSKIKLIVLIGVILVSLSIAGGGFYLLQKERVRNVELGNMLDELTVKQKAGEAKLLEAQKSISSLESKLKDTASQIDSLSNQLQQEKTAKEEALTKIENRLTKAQNDVKNIQAKLGTIETEKAKLESKVKELEAKANVELGKIVVSPESVQVKPPVGAATVVKAVEAKAQSLEGKVLVLNKEYNFVVINLGNKDGIAVGDQFAVYHGDKYIGDVKVEKLQDVMSAAGFASDDVKNKVKEGDKVVRKS